MIHRSEGKILKWLILLGALGLAIMASKLIGLSPQWQDAAVYTVIVFVAVILALKPAWGRAAFWRSVALTLAGHAIVLLIAVQALPHTRFGFPKLLLIPIGLVETFIILAFLWRRMAALGTSKMGDDPPFGDHTSEFGDRRK